MNHTGCRGNHNTEFIGYSDTDFSDTSYSNTGYSDTSDSQTIC